MIQVWCTRYKVLFECVVLDVEIVDGLQDMGGRVSNNVNLEDSIIVWI